jgi:hypothetical protein
MALPKVLNRIEQKLDRILELLEQPTFPVGAPDESAAELDPAAVAAALDYESYNAKEIIERVASLTDAERAALAQYEAANQGRKTVLEALA